MKKGFLISLCMLDFLPLWVVVVFLDCKALFVDCVIHKGAEWCGLIGCGCGVLVSLMIVWFGLREKLSQRLEPISLVAVKEKKTLTAEVLLSYVLPLLAFDFGTWVGLVQFLVFFCVIAVLNLRPNAIVGNVALGLIGYRFYECEYANGSNSVLVMTRRYLSAEAGMGIEVGFLNDEVAIEKCSK